MASFILWRVFIAYFVLLFFVRKDHTKDPTKDIRFPNKTTYYKIAQENLKTFQVTKFGTKSSNFYWLKLSSGPCNVNQIMEL